MSSLFSTLYSLLPFPLPSLLSNYTLTSLNALFFYLTWLTLVLSHSPFKISLLLTCSIRLLCFWLPALSITAFDLLLPDLASGWKYHPSSVAMLPSTAPLLLLRSAINDSLSLALHALALYLLPKPLFPVSLALPLLPTMAYDLFLSQLLSSGLYYYLHRAMHYALPSIHQTHHSHPPTPLLAHAQNPLDYIILSLLPTYLVPVLRRSHILTFLLILAVQSAVDVLRFSGYKAGPLTWGVAGGLGRRTEEHYYNRGTCYFGIWGILDYLHGTSPPNLEADARSALRGAKRKARKEWEEKWEKPLPEVPMPLPWSALSSGEGEGKGRRGKLVKPRSRAVSRKGEGEEGVVTRSRRKKGDS